MTSHDPHNDDERELAALYRSLPRAEPGAALDEAVLGKAARALAPVKRRRPRWPVALATAATIVLAAGLAWHVRQETPVMPAAVPTAKTVPADVPVAVPARPAITAKVASTGAEGPRPDLRQTHTAPKIVPQVAASRVVSSRRADSHATPAPAQALAPPPAPAPPAPPAPAPMMEAAPAPIAGGYMGAMEGPEQRIEEIRRRLRAGDRDGAERAFGALRERYPDYPLPDDLRPLVR